MTNYVTQEGLKKLNKELEERKTKIRREIAQAIKEAKEQGDLSENAEYSEAKRQQRENESQIMKLENIIRTSVIINEKSRKDIVEIGSEIEVESKNKKLTFKIVGSSEADPLAGKISNESPMGKSFLGKKKGESFDVLLPSKKKVKYKIIKIF